MPGIAGIVGTSVGEAASVVQAMARLQCWGAATATEQTTLGGAAFARCGIAGSPFECALCLDEPGGVMVALDGFVTDVGPLQAIIGSDGPARTPAEMLREAYRIRGASALFALRGQFAAVVWDAAVRTAFMATDKAGARNLYWTLCDGSLIFTSQLTSLLAVRGLSLALDDLGVAEFLTLGYPTGDLTLFKDVHILRPGRLLTYDGRNTRIDVYWKPDVREGARARPLDEAAEELHHRLEAAHRRCTRPVASVGLGLSGGRDSRLVAGYLESQNVARREGFAFDIGEHGESHIARMVADACGMAFYEIPVTLEDYIRQHEDCSWISGGGINSCEFLNVARAAQGRVNAFTWGFGGDTLSGRPISPLFYTAKTRDELLPLYFKIDSGPMLAAERHAECLHPEFYRRVRGAVREHYWRLFAEHEAVEPVNLWTLHDFAHRQRRRTLRVVSISESYVPTVYPFLDDEVIECFLAMPPQYKKYQRAYGRVLVRYFPKLAAIRCGEYNISMGRELALMRYIQMARRVKRYVKGLWPRVVPPRLSAIDRMYAEGFRRELREYARDCLLSLSRTRGLLREEFAMSMLERHISGEETSHYLLLKLTTLEIFLRQMLDRRAPAGLREAVAT